MKNKYGFFIVLAIALLMSYTAVYGLKIGNVKILGAPDIRYGIDIRGGVDATFQTEGLDRKPTAAELESAREIIEIRLDQQNIVDRDVTIDKQGGFVIVRFPWKSDETNFNPEEAIAELGEMAQLTFQDAEGNVVVEGKHVTKSTPEIDPQTNQYVVALTFDEEGTKLFSEATGRLVGKQISIFMDNTNIQTATVNQQITSGNAMITGMDSYEEAKALSDKINAGALPFSLVTKNYSTISPTMGSDALNVMLQAGIIAYILICIILISYYRIPGLVGCIALTIQIAGQILAISIPQMTLTLQGIAGIILSIGMGVDANVISAERINEEIRTGKSVNAAIKSGYANSFSAIFDGNITVLIVSFVLMIFGSGSLMSFAYSLFTGIVFNFVAGVSASRVMTYSLSSYKIFNKPAFYTCLSRRVTL